MITGQEVMNRNLNAIVNKAVLLDENNEAEFYIFIEDSKNSYKKFYKLIFKKILVNKKFVISDTGGKEKSIQCCKLKKTLRNKPCFYIIDGDIDLLYGSKHKIIKNLYRFKRYCIENYLIEEKAIIEATKEVNLEIVDSEELQTVYKFHTWYEKNKYLLDLYIYYAIIMFNAATAEKEPNVNKSLFPLSKTKQLYNEGYLDKNKICKEIKTLKQSLQKLEVINVDDKFKKIFSRIKKNGTQESNLIRYVSGKKLMELIYNRSKHISKNIGAKDLFFQRLAFYCEFIELKDEILRFINLYNVN